MGPVRASRCGHGASSEPASGRKLLPSTVPQLTTRRVVGVSLLGLAGLWLLFNEPFEGPTLVVVTPNHGLTVADLPALATILIALVVLVADTR